MRLLIWKRYLLREMLKVFVLVLGSFFFLYALIDYSLHMQDFVLDRQVQISHLCTYYGAQFIKRADLLIPLALLLATLKTLFSFNLRGELIALQASGIPSRVLVRPLFLVALVGMFFNLLSAEYLLPYSLNTLDKFRQDHFKHSRHHQRKEPIHALSLKDGSKLIYHTEDKEHHHYQDVFWVRSSDEIWHMKALSTQTPSPEGIYVDRLARNREGHLVKAESFENYTFTKLRLDVDLTGKGFIPLENRKISDLFRLYRQSDVLTAYEQPQALTHLLFKLTIPCVSLLVVAASAPICFRQQRQLPLFLIYTTSLFLFVAFFAAMDAAVILGENLTCSPYLAILAPLGIATLLIKLSYRRI